MGRWEESKIKLTTKSNIIEMNGRLDCLNFSTDVKLLDLIAEIRYGRVSWVISAKDPDCFLN
jgi:hypothetical protein